MPLEPKLSDFPSIRRGLKLYEITAIITGVLLLLLVFEMVLKYGFDREIELFGSSGLIAFVPTDTVHAVNGSVGLLIVHGWFYVIYLLACFDLWSKMRWQFPRFLLLALGGIVPFLSFILEARFGRGVNEYLTAREAKEAAA